MNKDNTFSDILTLDQSIKENSKDSDLLSRLKKLKVDPFADIPPPPTILNMNGQPIFSINGMSIISGKAKSRKSFFVSAGIAALLKGEYGVLTGHLPVDKSRTILFNTEQGLKGEYGVLTGHLPVDKSRIILFDTEQEPYRVQRIMKRIENMTGDPNPKNLEIYRLRGENTNDRLTLIETALKYSKNLGIVFIDGIRDLLFDINSPEQATELVNDTFMGWTEWYKIHLCGVLHQNKAKGNTDPRGHLGTEMINKSEAIISVAKDEKNRDISIVTPEDTRDKEPEPTAFYIDESVTPVIPVFDENYIVENNDSKAPKDPDSFMDSTHEYVLKETFKKLDKPKHTELLDTLLIEFSKAGLKISNNKMRTFIQYYVNNEYLTKHGKKPHVHYILNIDKINIHENNDLF